MACHKPPESPAGLVPTGEHGRPSSPQTGDPPRRERALVCPPAAANRVNVRRVSLQQPTVPPASAGRGNWSRVTPAEGDASWLTPEWLTAPAPGATPELGPLGSLRSVVPLSRSGLATRARFPGLVEASQTRGMEPVGLRISGSRALKVTRRRGMGYADRLTYWVPPSRAPTPSLSDGVLPVARVTGPTGRPEGWPALKDNALSFVTGLNLR